MIHYVGGVIGSKSAYSHARIYTIKQAEHITIQLACFIVTDIIK